MPRIRFIKHEFFMDDDLALQSHSERLAFIGLWTLADRAGRLEDKPHKIKAMLFPYENIGMDAILEALSGRFICRYEVSGKRFIQINNFLKHQRPHVKESNSAIPPKPGKAPEKPGEHRKNPASTGKAGAKTLDSGVLITDSGVLSLDSGHNNRDAVSALIKKSASDVKTPSAVDFSNYRLPKNFGRYGGAYVVNIPPDECDFLIAQMRPGPKVRAALEWRIQIKKEESIR